MLSPIPTPKVASASAHNTMAPLAVSIVLTPLAASPCAVRPPKARPTAAYPARSPCDVARLPRLPRRCPPLGDEGVALPSRRRRARRSRRAPPSPSSAARARRRRPGPRHAVPAEPAGLPRPPRRAVPARQPLVRGGRRPRPKRRSSGAAIPRFVPADECDAIVAIAKGGKKLVRNVKRINLGAKLPRPSPTAPPRSSRGSRNSR